MPMHTINVAVPGKSYDVLVSPGLSRSVGDNIKPLVRSNQLVLIADSTVLALHRESVIASLCAGFDNVIEASIPPGEANKNLDTVGRLFDEILKHRIDRSTTVIALGGGVTGDLAGFVAATLLRGLPFVQVPTTLLAMVDASVGGKTGVDHPCGKNLIGAFHQPIAVLIDPQLLRTLPARELRNGLAECIKHEIIRDANGFTSLEHNIDRALGLDMDYLTDLIAHNVSIKAKVVAADPLEKGERAHLNFGHTFGHAIESVSSYEYSHGESVALGMCAASQLAVDLKMLDEASRNRIVGLIAHAGLPTNGLKLSLEEVTNAMLFDKKAASRKLRFIVPDRIGHVVIRDDVPSELVRSALQSLQD